jgi:hypothetical protein
MFGVPNEKFPLLSAPTVLSFEGLKGGKTQGIDCVPLEMRIFKGIKVLNRYKGFLFLWSFYFSPSEIV